MRQVTVLMLAISMVACKADIKVDYPGVYECTDTRDGETFMFDNRTARDGEKVGWSDACVTVTDTEGAARRLCKAHLDNYLKCKKLSALPGTTDD